MGCAWSHIEDSDGSLSSDREYLQSEKLDLSEDEGATIQGVLWVQSCQRKLDMIQQRNSTRNTAIFQRIALDGTFESSLQSLTVPYYQHGFAAWLPKVQAMLNSIRPFTAVITAMVSSHPEVAGLLWGCVRLIFQSVIRYKSMFDQISSQLEELSEALPRLHALVDVLHTPRLHEALRGIYEKYIDFCFVVMKFLNMKCFCALYQSHSGTTGRRFAQARRDLDTRKARFEAEAKLANVQIQATRHKEILAQFQSLPTPSMDDIITVGVAGQNVMFTGRDKELSELHQVLSAPPEGLEKQRSSLSPRLGGSYFSTQDLQARRICVVHGIGGMGKSETALEYAHRYRSCYSHIFWLHAQTDLTLIDSFVAVIKRLELDKKGGSFKSQLEDCLQWFQSKANQWLLIYDNAESASVLKQYWPLGTHGSILLTSQDPSFVQISHQEIHLQPMTVEDGSMLIQRYLRRGASEQTAAGALSENLGGLPLAITHFAGYVAQSQCTLEHILDQLRPRFKASQVWSSEVNLSASPFAQTLSTVWDLAWQRLTPNARKILDIMAFLNPDEIPVGLFLGDEQADQDKQKDHWDCETFNEAVRKLRERHLIERDMKNGEGFLRIHRALQRNMLQKMNADTPMRNQAFCEALGLVRKAFPLHDPARRGDLSKWPLSKKYLPQVQSLSLAYSQLEPQIPADMALATLFRDAGGFLLNFAEAIDGVPILRLGERICDQLIQSDNSENSPYKPVLADVLNPLQIYCQGMGLKGRHDALAKARRHLAIRHEIIAGRPQSEWTPAEGLGLAMGYVDVGMTLSQFDDMDAADECWRQGEEVYHSIGGEDQFAARLGLMGSCRTMCLAVKQRKAEARARAQHSCALAERALGKENPVALLTRFFAACAAFTIGDFEEAVRAHEEIFEARARVQGASHHSTLASCYCVAAAHQATGNLERAEHFLQETLKHSQLTIQWRIEDVARTQFRLAIVLEEQNRPTGAAAFRAKVLQACEELPHILPRTEGATRELGKDLTRFDSGVSLWHGRTTGIWGNGRLY